MKCFVSLYIFVSHDFFTSEQQKKYMGTIKDTKQMFLNQ